MAVAQGTKPAKKASAPKKAKTGPSHPPYIEMVKEALVSLKERTGSSTYAIAKHIEEQQKVRDLPPNFRKVLAVQIKKFVASGKLVKVKNSFKLPPTTTTAKKSSPATTTDLKPKPKSKETAPKKTTTITSKPKPKSKETASKKKTTTTSKPKSKETASKKKTTATSKPKAAAVAKKVAKSPVKKLAAKKVAAAKAKKPKSVKSPMKNAPAAKKVKK